jgi:hypothetical protein
MNWVCFLLIVETSTEINWILNPSITHLLYIVIIADIVLLGADVSA